MSKPQWTPGPWRLYDHRGWIEVASETRGDIADIVGDDTDEDDLAEAIANARLIAAAPRLYGAAKAILDRLDYLRELWGDEGISRGLCDDVRAAIAEAEGGAP